jgi:C_GCAxxG_C_C family probable redox protein
MKLFFASEAALLDEAERRGHQYEACYHGCAQCALAALMDVFPEIRSPSAFRAASGMAGGIGLSIAGSCGALAGGVMAASLVFGRELDHLADPEGLRFTAYRLAGRLQERFEDGYGSGICSRIQEQTMGRSYPLHDPEQFDQFVKDGGHSRYCPQVVGKGARWAAEIILEELKAAGVPLEFEAPQT